MNGKIDKIGEMGEMGEVGEKYKKLLSATAETSAKLPEELSDVSATNLKTFFQKCANECNLLFSFCLIHCFASLTGGKSTKKCKTKQ